MGRESLEQDGRHFTGVVQGRRLGEAQQQPSVLSISDLYGRADRNRKHLRLSRSESEIVQRLAQVVDSIPELTFQQRRAFFVTEAEGIVANGTFRVSRLLNMGSGSIDDARQIVQSGEIAESLTLLREQMAQPEEPRQLLHTSGE